MQSDYLIVDKSILPDYYQKVVDARALLAQGKIKEVSEAVKLVGISRSTYYKYRDYVFAPNPDTICKKAVVSLTLPHETGTLETMVSKITQSGASFLTINQNMPLNGQAHIVFSIDLTNMIQSIDELLKAILDGTGASNIKLVAIE